MHAQPAVLDARRSPSASIVRKLPSQSVDDRSAEGRRSATHVRSRAPAMHARPPCVARPPRTGRFDSEL